MHKIKLFLLLTIWLYYSYNKSIMRKLNKDKRTQILSALIEGCSINATRRMCRVSKLTVLRLLADVGQLCRDFHDLTVPGRTGPRMWRKKDAGQSQRRA